MVSALASLNGAPILAGVRGAGVVWRIYPGNFGGAVPSTGFSPTPGARDEAIVDIVVTYEGTAYAVYNYTDTEGRAGTIYWANARAIDAFDWAPLPWTPRSEICCLAYNRYGPSLFAATDDQVYASTDGGSTWSSQSAGLPQRPHCSSLACVYYAGGTGSLYLSTFGWSTWVAALPAVEPPRWREVSAVLVLGSGDAGRVLVPINSPDPGPEIGIAIYRLAASIPDSASRTAIQQEAIKVAQSELAKLAKPTHLPAARPGEVEKKRGD
jgi:hypothetical protein